MKKNIPALSALGSALLLAACGGGGSSPGSSSSYAPISLSIQKPSDAVNNAGTTVSLSGSANTPNTIIKSMSWTASPAGATLTNADCSAAAKTSQAYTANNQNSTGTSAWSCAVDILVPITLGARSLYTLTLTATDDKGNTQSSSQDVPFAVAPTSPSGAANGLAASAGNNFTADPNSTNALHCSATGGVAPYSFLWRVSNNGGVNVPLSAYTGADTTFVAPAASAAGLLSFSCLATDASKFTATSVVSASINTASAPATFAANAGTGFSAPAGSKNALHCSASGGTAPYAFAWSVSGNGGVNVPLSSYTGADTTFVAPNVSAPALLSFSCQATDANKLTSASPISVSVNAATAPTSLAANAGTNFSAIAGSKNDLHCDATGGSPPYAYQWVVQNNGGYNFTLSSYLGADTSFTAPAVGTQTIVSATCRATDSQQATASSTVSTRITPPSAATGNALVASIAQPPAASPGSSITLDGSNTGWFDPSGKLTAGPTVSYAWTSSDPQVVLSNPTSIKTTATFPSSYTAAANVGFTLKATAGANSSSSSVNVFVDLYGPLTLSVSPPATVSKGNTAVSIIASASGGAGSPRLYYQWSQISGPVVALGGSTTPTLGIVPREVAAGATEQYVFRVAVGYAPITVAYPGAYFADANVTATP